MKNTKEKECLLNQIEILNNTLPQVKEIFTNVKEVEKNLVNKINKSNIFQKSSLNEEEEKIIKECKIMGIIFNSVHHLEKYINDLIKIKNEELTNL